MIDFHLHVLPGIDDGSKDLDMSAAMIREEASQGTEVLIATPHFYADRDSVSRFLNRRDDAFEQVKDWAEKQDDFAKLPRIFTGAEVYYFSGMGKAEALPDLCVQGTKTLLLEMPFSQWTDQILEDVNDILRCQKLTVVLAHIERYIEFQKDRRVWNEVFELPVVPQINTGSFLKKGGFFHRNTKRKFCFRFLEEHPRLILGSDAHNITSRRPNLADGRAQIASELGEDALRMIDETTKGVLGL